MSKDLEVFIEGKPYTIPYRDISHAKRIVRDIQDRGLKVTMRGGNEAEASAAWHGLLQGATLGFADEIGARFRSLLGKGDYEELRDENRLRNQLLREESPKTFMASELGGGFLLPGGAFAKAGQAASRLGTAAKAASAAGTGGALGAAAGYGASESEDSEEQLMDALKGGAAGAAFGLGGSYVAPVVGRALQGAKDRFLTTDSTRIKRNIATHLLQGGKSAEDVTEEIQKLGADAMIADLNEGLAGLAVTSSKVSPEAGALVGQRLKARQKAAPGVVKKALERAYAPNVRSGKYGIADEEYREVAKRLAEEKRQAGIPYRALEEEGYIPASEMGDKTDPLSLRSIIRERKVRPKMEEALYTDTKIQQQKKRQGKPLRQHPPVPPGKNPGKYMDPFRKGPLPIKAVNIFKKDIDKRLYGGASAGPQDDAGHVLQIMRDNLVEAADKAMPEYANMRKAFQEVEGKRDALAAGLRVGKSSTAEAVEAAEDFLANGLKPTVPLTTAQKDHFRRGIMHRLVNKVSDVKTPETTNFGKLLYSELDVDGLTPAQNKILELGSRNKKAFDNLTDTLHSQTVFGNTRSFIDKALGPLQTSDAAKQLDDEVLTGAGRTMGLILANSKTGLVNRLLSSNAITKVQAEAMGEILSMPNPPPEMLLEIAKAYKIRPGVLDAIAESQGKGSFGQWLAGSGSAASGSQLVSE